MHSNQAWLHFALIHNTYVDKGNDEEKKKEKKTKPLTPSKKRRRMDICKFINICVF